MKAVLLLAAAATVAALHGLSGSAADNAAGPWIYSVTIPIQAGGRTTVTLFTEDSSATFTLFDSILERKATLKLVHQPSYWMEKEGSDSVVVLPFPVLKAGLYILEVQSPDTSYTDRFLLME